MLKGYNSTIMAYGQTGTGKTYSIEGEDWFDDSRGIVPRASEQIFDRIAAEQTNGKKSIVRISYYQIYNEIIQDLLSSERNNLQIREASNKEIFIENLSEQIVSSSKELLEHLCKGRLNRITAPTLINSQSSRSHSILSITLEQIQFEQIH